MKLPSLSPETYHIETQKLEICREFIHKRLAALDWQIEFPYSVNIGFSAHMEKNLNILGSTSQSMHKFTVFVAPQAWDRSNPTQVDPYSVFAHEMVHVAVSQRPSHVFEQLVDPHGPTFVKCANELGLVGEPWVMVPGEELYNEMMEYTYEHFHASQPPTLAEAAERLIDQPTILQLGDEQC